MPDNLQKKFKPGVLHRWFILLGAILLIMIWSVTFFVLRQGRQAAEASAEQTTHAVLHGCLTRADDVFQDAYECIYLAQAAENMGVPFAPLYEGMETGRRQVDVIDHVIQFDQRGEIFYSSTPMLNLPVELAHIPKQNEPLSYIVSDQGDNDPDVFYIVGTFVSGNRLAVAVKSRVFAEFVRPSTLGTSFQLSLANYDNQLFFTLNTDIDYLTRLNTVRKADECIFWENAPDGKMTIAGISDIQSAPFSLRIALPDEVLLGNYYKYRKQLIITNVIGSIVLIVCLVFCA